MSESYKIVDTGKNWTLFEGNGLLIPNLLAKFCGRLSPEERDAFSSSLEALETDNPPQTRSEIRQGLRALIELLHRHGKEWEQTETWRLLIREDPATLALGLERPLAELENYPVDALFSVSVD